MVAKSGASTCAILTTGTVALNSSRGSVLLKTRRQRRLVVKIKTKMENENVSRAC